MSVRTYLCHCAVAALATHERLRSCFGMWHGLLLHTYNNVCVHVREIRELKQQNTIELSSKPLPGT